MHYVKRFFTSLAARSLSDSDVDWVKSHLSDQEFELWNQHSRADKRHTYDVARRVEVQTPDKDSWRIEAALMHDIGKLTCDLSTFGRVFATLTMLLIHRRRIIKWQDRNGWRGEFGRYCAHPELGAELLRTTNCDRRVATWAGEHHLSSRGWSIPYEDGVVLKSADHG